MRNRAALLFTALLAAGVILRLTAGQQLQWFFGEFLHVDEITWTEGGSPPFERPPGNYLLASVTGSIAFRRALYSGISLLPAVLFFLLRPRSLRNSLLAGVLAVEPTLAFSGLQIMPEAPAAALLAGALCLFERRRSLAAGLLMGLAVLFRGELLIFLPVSLAFLRPFRRWLSAAIGVLMIAVPLMTVNLLSGGHFTPGENGALNLWLGSSWELLTTPPGLEYEELVGDESFTDNAVGSILEDPVSWAGRGLIKTAAFFTITGPGRNMETPFIMGSSVLVYLLPLTGLILAFGVAGTGRDPASALMVSALLAAFLFFPSVRHRAVFLPAFVTAASSFRWRAALPAAACVAGLSILLSYPGGVRPGLTGVQMAQQHLEKGRFHTAFEYLDEAVERGYRGADLHNIRGACIASSGGDLGLALEEFSMALRLAPGSPSAWRNMAVVLWNMGNTEEALHAAETAVELNPALRPELTPILSCPR